MKAELLQALATLKTADELASFLAVLLSVSAITRARLDEELRITNQRDVSPSSRIPGER